MKTLQDKIQNEAFIIDDRIVKVDHFINHMLDTNLLFEIRKEFAKHFEGITKIVTIEASGIAFAVATANALNNVPIVFARKSESLITSEDLLSSKVYSYTKQKESTIIIDSKYISKDDTVLIIDDFLALGNAAMGLIDIVEQANATVVGVGIVIEKGFQNGRKRMEDKGIKVVSLANIKEINNGKITFN